MNLRILISTIMFIALCTSNTFTITEQIDARSNEYNKDQVLENRLLKVIAQQNTGAMPAKILWNLLDVVYKPSSMTRMLPNYRDTLQIRSWRNTLEQFADDLFNSVPYVSFQMIYLLLSTIRHLNQVPHGNMALLERIDVVLQHIDIGFLGLKMGELVVLASLFYGAIAVE